MDGLDATSAAYEVGYESVSQLNSRVQPFLRATPAARREGSARLQSRGDQRRLNRNDRNPDLVFHCTKFNLRRLTHVFWIELISTTSPLGAGTLTCVRQQGEFWRNVYAKRKVRLVRAYDQRHEGRRQVLFGRGRVGATKEMPGTDGPQYTTFNIDKVGIAGMLSMPGHTSWIGYIAVDDVDAHIEKIVEAGGKLLKPATDVPEMLRFAVMSDPRVPPLWSSRPIPACRRQSDTPRRRPARSDGTSSTQLTSKADSISTTSSLAGPRSAIWIWGPWASTAFSMKANTRKWETVG